MNPVSQVDIRLGAILTKPARVGRPLALVGENEEKEGHQKMAFAMDKTHQRYRIRQTELIYPEDISPVSII